jgi:hypothetical protein
MKKSSYAPADINDGFVVAVTIEAKEGEADAVAALIAGLVAPTLARASSFSFPIARRPIRGCFLSSNSIFPRMDGARIRKRRISRPPSANSCRALPAASAFRSCPMPWFRAGLEL